MFKIKDAWQIVENTQGVQIYTDIRDGQQYRYKQFGTQIWMIDNWNYGGLPGDYVDNPLTNTTHPAARYKNVDDYQNWESEYGLKRGALYLRDNISYESFRTAVIPSGWHIPTKAEVDTLIAWANTEYAGFGVQALMAKTTFWCPNNPSSSVIFDNYNKSGFDLVPAGVGGQTYQGAPVYKYVGNWSESEMTSNCVAYIMCLQNATSFSSRYYYKFQQEQNNIPTAVSNTFTNQQWCSIRLIKDGGAPDPQPIITEITTTLDSTGSDNKIATEKATRTAITNAVSSKMSNPMTSVGDMIVGGSSGAPSRLGVGSPGQVLKVGITGITWDDEAVVSISDTNSIGLTIDQNGDLTADLKMSSEPDNILQLKDTGNKGLYAPPSELDGLITTSGDLIVGDTSGAPAKLSVGTTGQVLKVGSNGIGWEAESGQTLYLGAFDSRNRPQDATTGQFILDTDLGYMLYRYGSAWINATGTVYEGSVTPSGNDPVRWLENPMTSAGDLIVGGASGSATRLGMGSEGQVLTVGSSGIEWANGGGGGGGGADSYHLQFPDHKIYAAANYIHFVKIPGIILPEKIGSWTFWPRESPTTVAGFRCWCALFEERDNSQNINISSFTYPATPPTPNRSGDPITFNFDSPVTIDKTKLYRVGIWFGGTGISTVFVNAPQTAQDTGNWTWFGCGYASETPPANTSGLSSSNITDVPWFSLNERTI